MGSNCIFCKIIKGEIPTDSKIFEDENCFVFLSISPVNFGHALVIPKKHFENIYEVPDELIAKLSVAIKKTAKAVKKAVNAHGINIANNNERPAGQVVPHLHFHIIPRFSKDGDINILAEHHKKYKNGEAKSVAEKIKSEWE
jgi:histidine triad (HIT) family protein